MGKKFTITEEERKHIKGLYEQEAPERVFNITKAAMSVRAGGTITITNESIKCNFSIGKQDYVGEVHIDKKMTSGTMETFICSGEFFGSDKHVFSHLPQYKSIMWEANNPVDGKMRPGITLNYK